MPRYKDMPPINKVPDPRQAKKPEGQSLWSRVTKSAQQLLSRPSRGRPGSSRQSGRSDEFAKETTVSRRGFAIGAASTIGVGAGVAYIASRIGMKDNAEEDTAAAPVVVDSGDATNITESFSEVESIRLVEHASYDLPLGSVLNPAEGVWVPVTQPGLTSNAITCAAAFNIQTGDNPVVVAKPITNDPSVMVLDVRCSDSVYAWSEVNIADRSWSLYASAWRGGKLTGDISTLWQSDANWDVPHFCCTGDQVLWQVQPSLSGEKTTESSGLFRWRAGDSSADKILDSPGRFACEPSVSNSVVTVVPRVQGENSASAYYGITALSKSDLSNVVDQLVMPASVRPFKATRIGDQFAFSVEATYGSGGLLSNMGYYVGTSTSHITWLSREPSAGVWGKDGAYVFKSRASYLVVSQPDEEFGVLLACDRSVDYGEYPAATGDTDMFVTYATVKDPDTGLPAMVTVRTFDLISAEEARKRQEEAEKAKAEAEAEAAENEEEAAAEEVSEE